MPLQRGLAVKVLGVLHDCLHLHGRPPTTHVLAWATNTQPFGPLRGPKEPLGGPKVPLKSEAMGAAQKREHPIEHCTFWKKCAPWAPWGAHRPLVAPMDQSTSQVAQTRMERMGHRADVEGPGRSVRAHTGPRGPMGPNWPLGCSCPRPRSLAQIPGPGP